MELLIVAYHYIDSEEKYKEGIHPTSPERFRSQLRSIGRTYNFISEEDLVGAILKKNKLPDKACLITFDDALISQYENALPVLEQESVPAVFYIPTQHFAGKAYKVHKIHYLLSTVPSSVLLNDAEKIYCKIIGSGVNWDDIGVRKITDWYRYDTEEVAKFKYLLNHCMEPSYAGQLVDKIFELNYNRPEQEFCDSFFLTPEHINKLNKHPLISLGLHTHGHIRIAGYSACDVQKSITENYSILHNELGVEDILGISFPYGLLESEEYEEKIKEPADKAGLVYGVTTEKKVNTDLDLPFFLGRYGTNDITGGKKVIFEV